MSAFVPLVAAKRTSSASSIYEYTPNPHTTKSMRSCHTLPSALRHDHRRPILNKNKKWRDVVPPFFIASILAVASLALCTTAPAQDYPTRPLRVIIPLGPGGGGDVFTRALA